MEKNKKEQIVENDNKKFDKRLFYNNDDSGKNFIFALLLPYIISFIFSFIASAIASGRGIEVSQVTSNAGFIIACSACASLSFVLIFFLYTKSFNISYKASTIKNKLCWQDSLITILVALVSFFGILMFSNLHDVFLGDILNYKLSELSLPLTNFGWVVLNILILAVLPAFCEELLFRGLILQGLRKNFSDKFAIFLSALMFALMHSSLQQLIYPFLLGLVFGWLALRTGTLWATIIAHFINNTIVILMAYINSEFASFQNVWWYYLLAFVLLILTGVIFWLIDKFYFKRNNKNDVEKERVVKASPFVLVGIIIGFVLLIFSIILNYVS